jgi:NAD(P)H-dependent flavin oxidoreductase YrpB (nitropropane dioxygenase family)
METPAAAYGAMLAGVDVVLVGAGIPSRLPGLLDLLADHRRVNFPVDVEQSAGSRHGVALDPEKLFGSELPRIRRPSFLAIVSSHTLAAYLARDGTTRPDGFVVEGSVAGGHNAPPRGPLQLDERGSPIYGPRDEADIDRLRALELPFWVAGARSTPRRLEEALSEGASGVQVGTLFALAEESGLDPSIRCRLLETIRHGTLAVDTDPRASPTGYPFKIAQMTGTLADRSVYQARQRLCDLGYLRVPYLTVGGGIGYRCAAEPIGAFVRKGGERTQTVGRMCLCNGLMATAGFPQRRRAGAEVPVVTLGADLSGASELLRRHPGGWRARDVITYLTKKDRSAEAQSESLSAL